MEAAEVFNCYFGNVTGVLLVSIGTLAAVWVYKRAFIEHQFFKKYGIDGPKPDLFFGNFCELKEDRVGKFSEWIAKYGDHYGIYYGATPVIISSNLDTLRELLIKESANFLSRPEACVNVDFFNNSLLFLEVEKWKSVRAVLTSSFSAAKMRLLSGLVEECVSTYVEIIKEKAATGETFDMSHAAQGLTLDIITRCGLAMNTNCQRDNDGLRKIIKEFFDMAENRIVELAIAFPFLKLVLSFIYKHFATGGIVKTIISNLESAIKMRRAGKIPKQCDLLQLMLDAQEKSSTFDDKILIANSFLMLAAGYETSSTAIAFITQILVEKPEMQKKIRAELEMQFPGKTEFSYEELHSLKFLQNFINECLRLYPPVILFVSRVCVRDITLNGHFFPAGCQVMVPVYHLHHSPELWDAPEEFRPERFAADAGRDWHQAQFLPFGLGPRACFGARFAMFEIKMALVKLLKEVRLKPGDGFASPPELEVPSVIMTPKNGIPVKAELLQ